MITPEVKAYIDKSVLCWLATTDDDGMPNVSPKEVFAAEDDEHLVIANIASPQSLRNLQGRPLACASFVDVFVQKGYKLKGTVQVIAAHEADFALHAAPLLAMTKGRFPIHHVFRLRVSAVAPIVAPSYRLFSDTTEAAQRQSAMLTYGVRPA